MEKKVKKILFSEVLVDATTTQKIAIIAIMTALCVVENMLEFFKFADTQFSLTILFSAFAGYLIGPIFGGVASFLGDLVGFLYNSGGQPYYPWIGITMAVIAIISGLILNGIENKSKVSIFIKTAIVSILTFLIGTVGINTTAFWLVFGGETPYFVYLFTRLFAKWQILNSIINYALLFIALPTFIKIKEQILKLRKNKTC